jgi:hypothetical protein
MKPSKEVIENSLINEYLWEAMDSCIPINDEGKDEFRYEIISIAFETCAHQYEIFLQFIEDLSGQQYMEARKYLGSKDDFSNYTTDISASRHNIKYLLTGLIQTTAITELSELECFFIPNGFDFENEEGSIAYAYLLHEFKKVSTLEELEIFNDNFRNILLLMLFRLCDLFIKKMNYTVQYFLDEVTFKELCLEAITKLEKFSEKVDQLKLTHLNPKVMNL